MNKYQIIHYKVINDFVTAICVYGEYTKSYCEEKAKRIHEETGERVEIVKLIKTYKEVADD